MTKFLSSIYKSFVCGLVAVLLLLPVKHAYASPADCPESYMQANPTGCFPVWSDISITTCAAAAAAHGTTITTLTGLITAQFALHAIYLDRFIFSGGINAMLAKMSEQISASHQRVSESMMKMNDRKMNDDAMRLIQKYKTLSTIAMSPSDEHCKFASMSMVLSAAENMSESAVWDNQNFLRSVGQGDSNSLGDGGSGVNSQRLDVICRYIDANSANGAFSRFCEGIVSTPEDQEKYLLADNLLKESLDDSYVEPINSAMVEMFFDNQPDSPDGLLFENDDMKIAYMDHRGVLAKQLLNTYCFQRTFQDKLSGTPITPYQMEALREMGLSDDNIRQKLGDNPSVYAQKKLLMSMAMNPEFGAELNDRKENVMRLALSLQSQKMAALYDSMEILHCNELILSQLLHQRLQPLKDKLQERFDTITFASQQREDNKDYAQVLVEEGGVN